MAVCIILLVLVIPVTGDDNPIAANESSETEPIEEVEPEETPLAELTPVPEVTEVPDPPAVTVSPEENSGDAANETEGSGPDGGNTGDVDPEISGDGNLTSVPDPVSSAISGIVPNSTDEETGLPVAAGNLTVLTGAQGNVTGTADGVIEGNESALADEFMSNTPAYCNVTPDWAAELVDPPLNETNLIPGIDGGDMWEINSTTGPGIYTLEINHETSSLIGIWIHDVSDVILDGMGHHLWGNETYIGIEGSIGILVNGTASNIQIRNFAELEDWADAIVIDSAENVTIGDSLNINHNANSGITVTDSTNVTITGNVNVHGNDKEGILIRDSSDIEISNNVWASDNYYMDGLFAHGNGIHVVNSSDVTLTGPVYVENSAFGIMITNSTDVSVLGDIRIVDCNYTGLAITSSSNLQVGENPSGHPKISRNGDTGIDLLDTTDIRINDTEIKSHGNYGVYSVASGQVLLHNITVQDTGPDDYSSGIKIVDSAGWHRIVNSTVENSAWEGIEVIDSNHTEVENSYLIRNHKNGIGFGRSTGEGSNYGIVANSSIYENYESGIMALSSQGLQVINNQISDNSADGINLWRVYYSEIRENDIYFNHATGINGTENCWGNDIADNRIWDNTDGIILQTSGNSNITGNSIYDGGRTTQNRGIVLAIGFGSNVSGNQIRSQKEFGIAINQSDDNRIMNNQINSTPFGIWVEQSNGTNIDDNIFTTHSVPGIPWITCTGSTFTSLHGNTIHGSALGLLVDHSNDTLVSGNTFDNPNKAIQLDTTERTVFEGNTIETLQWGIDCQDINDTTIVGNTIHSYNYGISFNGSGNTLVYNNDFENVDSIVFAGSNDVTWNVTPVPGPNIVGGPSIGGNYWSTPANTGWSQTNPDTDGDGFTDLPYPILPGQTDMHPLSIAGEYHPPEPKPPAPGGGDSVPIILTPPSGLTWGGSITSETFPDQVCAGSSVPVSVTVEAGGNSAWLPGTYGLGTYNDAAGSAGAAFIPVSGVDMVSPGQQYTFSFTITAPATPGTYTFQYRMQKSDGTWFGDVISITLNVVDCGGSKVAVKDLKTGSKVISTSRPVIPNPTPTITPWKKIRTPA